MASLKVKLIACFIFHSFYQQGDQIRISKNSRKLPTSQKSHNVIKNWCVQNYQYFEKSPPHQSTPAIWAQQLAIKKPNLVALLMCVFGGHCKIQIGARIRKLHHLTSPRVILLPFSWILSTQFHFFPVDLSLLFFLLFLDVFLDRPGIFRFLAI